MMRGEMPRSSVPRTCGACGAAQPAAAMFCGVCGAEIESSPEEKAVAYESARVRRIIAVPALVVGAVVALVVSLVAARQQGRPSDDALPAASPASTDKTGSWVGVSPSETPAVLTPVAWETPAPASCPVTIPEEGFVPPDRYGPGRGEGSEWYGSEDLWLTLDDEGEVWLEDQDGHLGHRYALWSVHQGEPQDEPEPDVRLVAERLDADAAMAFNRETTHGWTNSRVGRNLFMLTSIQVPTPGCWQVTATYRTASLTWIAWAAEAVVFDYQRFAIEVVVDDSSVSGSVSFNLRTGELCYAIELPGATAGHLHRTAAPDDALISFPGPPQSGRPHCQAGVDRELLQEIMAQPNLFHVEFHGPPEFLSGGAVQTRLRE